MFRNRRPITCSVPVSRSVRRKRRPSFGKHHDVIRLALDILKRRFCDDQTGEGYRKDGSVAAARFEPGGDDDGDAARERRLLRQPQVADIISKLVARL